MRIPSIALIVSIAGAACGSGSAETLPPAGDAATAAAPRPLATLWGAPTLVDENPDPDIVEVHLKAASGRAVINGKEVSLLTYNGTSPGPIRQARPRQRVIVHFENGLAEPTTVHWHGLRIPDAMDGSPMIQAPIPAGGTFTYDFLVPDAGSFWYHPHVNTHDQLERGLYGALIVQGRDDPLYDLERSLVLDDVRLDASGAIAPPSVEGLDGLTGRWGDVFLTNGAIAQASTATARRGQVERWRLLNSANARLMEVRTEGAVRVRLIATDGGLLPAPIDVHEPLTLAVGGRLDLEVSYEAAGDAKLLAASGSETPVTMLAVKVEGGPDAPRAIPWPSVTPAIPERAATARFDMLFDFDTSGGGAAWTVNGQAHWMAPILAVDAGATVTMRLANGTGGVAHPFHLHGQFFRVLDDPKWPGVRDTVMVPAIGPITIVAYLDNPGRWMAHCHILEHVALGMMAEIEVRPRAAPTTGPR